MRAEVFVDPFEEAAAEVVKERDGLLKKEGLDHLDTKKKEAIKPKEYGTGVGKYINREEKRKVDGVSSGYFKTIITYVLVFY